jgi:hypothetical protein
VSPWHDPDAGKGYGRAYPDSLGSYDDLLTYVRAHPETVADFLEMSGFTVADFEDHAGPLTH